MSLDLIKSFVETANNRDCDFPLNNLPNNFPLYDHVNGQDDLKQILI